MQLEVIANSTTLSYWFNWRVFLCAVWVFIPMVIASFFIWKYECSNHLKPEREETQRDISQIFCDDKVWKPCLKEIHPCWLLVFRVIAFFLLLTSLIYKAVINGGGIFFYYTQWTFTLVTIYFGYGSLLSIYGCYQHHKTSSVDFNAHHVGIDAEQGSYVPLTYEENTNKFVTKKFSNPQDEIHVIEAVDIWSYLFQVIFQVTAGAVMLTDCVYWVIIFPFLTIKDYTFSFMTVNMHTLNVILLLGDAALNCLPVPWIRISYFILWTGFFVIFQWIVHACVSIWWPYPFLDLSSPYAPLWYLLVALLHIPCYGLFALIVQTKHYLLSTWFSESYQCSI